MTEISAKLVKELREMTGAGMMDCKSALTEAGGSLEQAIEVLRKKGLKNIDKRAGKVAAEGTFGVYVHPGSQVVSVIELNCETDFVARGEEFQQVARDIAMHAAAMKPVYLSVEDVPVELIEREKEVLLDQLNDAQKAKADMIIPGKLEKFFEEVVLLNQPYVKDESGKLTVKNVVDELGMKVGEKVQIRRFFRMQIGEGIEKTASNLAEDVAAMTAPN